MQRASAGRPRQASLYTAEQRARRDATPWTLVQAILAPLQFVAFAVSLLLILRWLASGQGAQAAALSVLVKTGFLYAIMVTGACWEKAVFGRWLFAAPFFWEDVVSMAVIALHTAYLCLWWGQADLRLQFAVALLAYASYLVNAGQFLRKFALARRATAGVPA